MSDRMVRQAQRRGFWRRFELWLILAAVIVSLVISCSGCARSEPQIPPRTLEPSRVIARYELPYKMRRDWTYDVTEFRTSSGNICVYVASSNGGQLDCSPPLPPIHYNDLPEVDDER